MGTIYKPKYRSKDGTVKESAVWWLKYYQDGKPIRESSKKTKLSDAKKLLALREGEISQGKTPGYYFDKITFEDLAEDFIRDRRINNHSVPDAEKRLKNLTTAFQGMKVTRITTSKINKYVDDRKAEGAANATVNRELAALKRMLRLGAKHEPPKVNRVPHIALLEENNVKEGFFEEIEFEELRTALPSCLRGFATFGYLTGWRIEEVAGLEWDRVNVNDNSIRLRADETKNRETRYMKMEPALLEVIEERLIDKHPGCPFVFHREGHRIKDIRGIWNKACRETGLGYGYRLSDKYAAKWMEKGLPAGPTFHDFRRTAVMNMTNAGVPRNIAMKISGHKTESIYERYDIDSKRGYDDAATKMHQFRTKHKEATEEKEQGALLLYYLLQNFATGKVSGKVEGK
jgi:integrase